MPRTLFSRLCIAYVVIGAVLRCALIRAFGTPGHSARTWFSVVAGGAVMDLLVALVLVAIPRAFSALAPRRLAGRFDVRYALALIACAVMIFEATIEYFFFDEFDARFNHIALDYVLYPTEVFGNIWQSFAVARHAVVALLGGAVLAWLIVGVPTEKEPPPPGRRLARFVLPLVLGALAFAALWRSPATLVEDRVSNEIALSGPQQLGRAIWNASLDYNAFYLTLPRIEARQRTIKTLGFAPQPAEKLASDDLRLLRRVTTRRAAPLRSLVVVLEESLGSDFVGCLGGQPADLTPNLDRWSREGLLLTNLIATGNRTVRGIEGVLCSMVPLPGDAIVKRPDTHKVDALPTLLARQGYSTAFYYGGRGLFDNIRSFATAVGYRQFHEQSDYPPGKFSTAWGVADEFIFDAALERQLQAKKAGEKLFLTILSVSNHKPYLVPQSRTGQPEERNRRGAVRYSDWALGRWLDQMKSSGLLEDTAVLVVGDHGARVYGAERIPIRSYYVPGLFLVPDAEWKGRRIGRLCSQIDLAPTLLSLAGIACDAPFFGSSVLDLPESGGRAFVQHNHEVGMVDDGEIAVLGLRGSFATYSYQRGSKTWSEILNIELEQNAAAVFQTANELYVAGRLNTGDGR